jgi:hypothetical protein
MVRIAQLVHRVTAVRRLNSLIALALVFGYGFICLAVIRTLVPINCSADNTFFMPVSFMYIQKGELTNPWLNPIVTDHFNWHGFIHPMAVAALSIGKGWQGVNSGIVVLGVATFCVFLILSFAVAKELKFVVPAALIVVSMIISYSGRPETTVAFLSMFVYAANRGGFSSPDTLWQRGAWILSGSLIGAIAVTNPGQLVVVVLAQTCFASAVYGMRDNNLKQLCLALGVTFGTAMLSALMLLTFIYPYHATDWINGILKHAVVKYTTTNAMQSPKTDLHDYLKQLLLSKDAPLIIFYSLFLIPIASSLRRLSVGAANKKLIYFTYILFFLTAVITLRGVVTAFGRYNFTVFVPIILLIVGSLFGYGQLGKQKTGTLSLLYVLAAVAALTQFVWIYQSARSWHNVHLYNSQLREIVLNAIDRGLKVGVNGSILTAIDDADQLRKVRLIREDSEADARKFDLVILSQNEHPSKQPIQLRNFEIKETKYDPCCSLLFPRPLNNAFAVYRSRYSQ